MSALSHLALTMCYLSVAVTVLSLFLPQKRTRKIFSFVIGLFVICSLISAVRNTSIAFNELKMEEFTYDSADSDEYTDAVKQKTADNLVSAIDELLRSEGIEAKDIRLSLKISDEGRIYAQEVVIYIGEEDLLRKQEIESIIYRNLSKEPLVYVEKEEVE